ncbi:hypothetical protein RHGRI_016004 [Rhododendron griersonianum]|uniref:Uncharacterized protein n=1 Tax=Rhododendron griersonianum TaxID=479676 RepID=A0AAV6JS19_9ERIC|nr:hypothetical protein RHGRI_016004 [Rhododendron griersonianum]
MAFPKLKAIELTPTLQLITSIAEEEEVEVEVVMDGDGEVVAVVVEGEVVAEVEVEVEVEEVGGEGEEEAVLRGHGDAGDQENAPVAGEAAAGGIITI